MWINFHEEPWMDWLINKADDSLFVKDGNHPSETGIELWFNNFLKKYIDKVLDI